MKRRTFLKSIAASGVAASMAGSANFMLPQKAHAAKKVDIGEVKSVKIDVLTETSWFDNDIMKKNMMDYGGAMANQYSIPWDWDNAGGYAALVTVTTLEGDERKILLDAGWNTGWMDYIFEEKSDIAGKLKNEEIELLVLSHWHLDHLWGIESALKHNQNIKMYVPQDALPGGHGAAQGESASHRQGQDHGTGGAHLQERLPAQGRIGDVRSQWSEW
jgi:7,8-dihydropterin-6-yl-methyl-4-(beta-D-ribofuranosyl)aminobenzene 5'-phosphate synthase